MYIRNKINSILNILYTYLRELLILVLVITVFSILFYNKIYKSTPIPIVYQNIFDSNDPYTEVKLREYLIQLHIKYPEVALAQFKLETNSGKSNIFLQGNNLFGMKLASSRPTTALGSFDRGHAYYSHWRQSVIDYAIWQSLVENPENISTESNWIEYISKFYSKDNSYKEKLLKIKNDRAK